MASLYESMNKYFESKYGDDLDNVKKVEKRSLNESKKPVSRKAMKEGRNPSNYPVAKALIAAGIKMDGDINSPAAAKKFADKVISVLEDAKKDASKSDVAQFDRAIDIVNKRRNSPALLLTTIGTFYTGYKSNAGAPEKKDECVDTRLMSERMNRRRKMREAAEGAGDVLRNLKTKFAKKFPSADPLTVETYQSLYKDGTASTQEEVDSWYGIEPDDELAGKIAYMVSYGDEGAYVVVIFKDGHLAHYGLQEDSDDAPMDECLEYLEMDYRDQSGDYGEDFDESLKCAPKFKINRRKVESLKSAPKRHGLKESKRIVSRKAMKEDLGKDIARYQRYVDYDMKHYGEISKKTQGFIDKAGLQLVKDQYGNYEVTAGRYEEACRSHRYMKEANNNIPIPAELKKYYKVVSKKIFADASGDSVDDVVDTEEIASIAPGFKLLGYLKANPDYEDVMGDNGEDLAFLVENKSGKVGAYTTVGGRLVSVNVSKYAKADKKGATESLAAIPAELKKYYKSVSKKAFADASGDSLDDVVDAKEIASIAPGFKFLGYLKANPDYEDIMMDEGEDLAFLIADRSGAVGAYTTAGGSLIPINVSHYMQEKKNLDECDCKDCTCDGACTCTDEYGCCGEGKRSHEVIKEAKKKKGPDLWETIYGDLTDDGTQRINPETGHPYINLGAGYNYQDQVAVDRDGNIVVKTREERDLKAAIDVADKYKDKGVTYNIDQSKYDKRYPYWMTIEIPEEYKECFKESKLTEKRWAYTVSDNVSREFRDAVQSDDEDFERVRQAMIAVYKDIHENAPELLDDDDYEEWVTEELEVVDFDDEDDVNFELSNLYDFCDNAGIWIGI